MGLCSDEGGVNDEVRVVTGVAAVESYQKILTITIRNLKILEIFWRMGSRSLL